MRAREVLVTGARGKTGREVVAQLTAQGITTRAGSSRTGEAAGGARRVLFDWDRPETWAAALDGVDALYLMRPDLADAPDRVSEVVGLASHAHVVLLSEQGAGDLPDTSWERGVERAVTDRAARWTIVRPSWFQQVLTDERYYAASIRQDGILPLTTGGATIAFVDARDIAAVAVAALLEPERSTGAAYELTGPESLSAQDVADVLTRVVGRRVEAVDVPPEDVVGGLEPALAEVVGGVLRRVRDGVYAPVTDDVERAAGRPPFSLRAFAEEYAPVWRRP